MSEAQTVATPAPETIRSLIFRPGDSLPMVAKTAEDLITRRWSFVMTALSPIAHSSGADGNNQPLMVEPVFDPERPGEPAEMIPIITGNSMRHALRQALVWLTLRLAKAELGSLSDAAVHFLFEGGNMGKGASSLDLESYRWLVRTFPFAGLLGGGTGTSLMHGTLRVSDAVLICQQNLWLLRHFCPGPEHEDLREWFAQHQPAQAYRWEETRTRHDSRSNPLASAMQAEEGREKYLEGRFKAGSKRDRDEKSTSMPHTTEVIARGASLFWEVGVTWATPLEASALMCAITALGILGSVGAKGATGHGRISLRAASTREALIGEAVDVDDAAERAVRESDAAPYVAHVQERQEDIRSWLGRLK